MSRISAPFRATRPAAAALPTPRFPKARLPTPLPVARPLLVLSLAALGLAGCMPARAPAPLPVQPVAPIAAEPVVASVSGLAGLQERQPDACHAKDYVSALGQPGSVIPTLGITRQFRVVEYRGIEPQEYNALRIVFRLDQAGNIQNIDCG